MKEISKFSNVCYVVQNVKTGKILDQNGGWRISPTDVYFAACGSKEESDAFLLEVSKEHPRTKLRSVKIRTTWICEIEEDPPAEDGSLPSSTQ